jgi:hypothetical protein
VTERVGRTSRRAIRLPSLVRLPAAEIAEDAPSAHGASTTLLSIMLQALMLEKRPCVDLKFCFS